MNGFSTYSKFKRFCISHIANCISNIQKLKKYRKKKHSCIQNCMIFEENFTLQLLHMHVLVCMYTNNAI